MKLPTATSGGASVRVLGFSMFTGLPNKQMKLYPGFSKQAVMPCLMLISLIILSSAAEAGIALISPQEPALRYQSVTFTFNASDAVQECTLILNGVPNASVAATQNQLASITVPLNEGSYNWAVTCNASPSPVTSATKQLEIDLTAPEARLDTPFQTFNTSTVKLRYYPIEKNLKNCTLYIDAGAGLMPVKTKITPVSEAENEFGIELQDKDYSWNVLCFDAAGQVNVPLSKNTFRVDTTQPVMSLVQPFSVITSTSATLSLSTSEDSECRYSQSQQSYYLMSRFEVTSARQHQQSLTFESDGSYTYYASCSDKPGNVANPIQIIINVHMPPTAAISLDRASPVKSGILEVTVKTSKNMSRTPTLTYNTGEGAEIQVALSGSGDSWKGNALIDDTPKSKIATFSFKGTDIYGYLGTAITTGVSFIIDTIKPPKLTSVKAMPISKNIVLTWYSNSEDVSQYKIYRSTSQSVTYLDFYSNATNTTSFTDDLVEDKVTYYYSISAADKAGNIGDLSEPVYATARAPGQAPSAGSAAAETPQQEGQQPPEQKNHVLPPQLVIEVNDAKRKIESIKITVDQAQANMKVLAGRESELAALLGIKDQAGASSKRLSQLLEQLESLKSEYKEKEELHAALSQIEQESKLIESSTAASITISERIEDAPIIKKDQIMSALNKVLSAPELGANLGESYVSENEKELQDLQLKTQAEIIEITKTGGSVEKKSLITHYFTFTRDQPAKESLIIITVPKAIAASSKDIIYPEAAPEVLEDDPILKWGFLSIGPEQQKISYIISKKVTGDEVRQIQAVPLLDISAAQGSTQTPTGFAVLNSVQKLNGSQYWIVLPGLIMVIMLSGYYVITNPKHKARKAAEERKDRIPEPILRELNERLATIQVEIDEEIYPTLSGIRRSIAEKKEEGEASETATGEKLITRLIGLAKSCLARGETEKAKALYQSIQLIYQQMAKSQKAKFGKDCVVIYERLNKRL